MHIKHLTMYTEHFLHHRALYYSLSLGYMVPVEHWLILFMCLSITTPPVISKGVSVDKTMTTVNTQKVLGGVLVKKLFSFTWNCNHTGPHNYGYTYMYTLIMYTHMEHTHTHTHTHTCTHTVTLTHTYTHTHTMITVLFVSVLLVYTSKSLITSGDVNKHYSGSPGLMHTP